VPVYDAFISYSHAKDKPIAAALQSVTQKLGKPWYRRRGLRVFRDDTSLSATPQLWPSIEKVLGESRYLILLGSPESAASPWVSKEVEYWLTHKSADTLLIGVTDGKLEWDSKKGDFEWLAKTPLPKALKGRYAAEPKWVDLSAYRDGADPRDARFIELGADFAAAIHGMPKEDLLSQEVRQQRRALTLAWSAAGSLLVLVGVASWQWFEADKAKRAAVAERERAERNLALARGAANDLVFKIAQGLRHVEGMRVESVQQILETAQGVMDELARSAPDDPQLQRSRGSMLHEFSLTYADAGDLTRARGAVEESLEISRRLAAAEPDNRGRQSDLGTILIRVGEMRLAAGDRLGALQAYEETLAIWRELAAAEPANEVWQAGMQVGFEKVGDVRFATGDYPGALAAYEESLPIARKLAADPSETDWQRALISSLIRVGTARRAVGDRQGALSAYEESLLLVRRLVAADPGNTGDLRVLVHSVGSLGDVKLDAGDRKGALAAYEECRAVMRKLVASDPGNARWQRELSVSIGKLGQVRLASGDNAGALADYNESAVIARRLAAADPGSLQVQHDLGTGLEMVGYAQFMTGDRTGALRSYEESLAIKRKLAAADPDNAIWQAELMTMLVRVEDGRLPADRVGAPLREALDIAERLEREGKLPATRQHLLDLIRDMLAKLPPEQAEAR
jgi:tetratricopeptide (TPR) repeat protein